MIRRAMPLIATVEWSEINSVDLYLITIEGCVPLERKVPVSGGTLVLRLGKDEAVSIVPAGTGRAL